MATMINPFATNSAYVASINAHKKHPSSHSTNTDGQPLQTEQTHRHQSNNTNDKILHNRIASIEQQLMTLPEQLQSLKETCDNELLIFTKNEQI